MLLRRHEQHPDSHGLEDGMTLKEAKTVLSLEISNSK
ncbi:hypothetical protein BVRB_006150 [Beta vulgaris subsp. vulgaris]|uniref:Uncharacterized protein n=1 Tax=Beta vulgaris subsp. vulgaris TaxID=3555 RepID=A0A0J8DXT1_BETVV|nr:hypothetical protein BVRB_006150 [Beta vulgaris subsp. vulgaris]